MSTAPTNHLFWHDASVTQSDREALLGQKGALIWFTGLSASGKSTLANATALALHRQNKLTFVLDGDNIRQGLNKNLGFSPEDREENIRRIAELGRLFTHAGVITLTAFISPYQKDRDLARHLIAPDRFIEVHVDAAIQTCEQRDQKGLYKKARAGEIAEFTGITAPYEVPSNPEIHLDADTLTIEQGRDRILAFLKEKGIVPVQTPNTGFSFRH